jgi:general secretion pathway protein J
MRPRGLPRLRDARGLTLVEILIAFTILGVIVVLLVTSLRVGVRAWEAGERRAVSQQELRAIVELITEAVSTAVVYRGRLGQGLERVVLFQGEADEVRFVTTAPPLVLDAPAAPYHAVTLRLAGDGELRLVERLVPADEPFGETPYVVLSRGVRSLRFEYRDDEGLWQSQWDTDRQGIPTAVRVELTLRDTGRADRSTTFTVPVPMAQASR